MDAPKRMTNALLAEHGLKQAKIAATLILKAKQVIGYSNEDVHAYLEKALQTLNEEIDWYASGEALQSFQQGDPDDEGEDYDTYAPEIYAMNSIDPSLLEFPPDYESGLKEAIQKRKAALLKASRPNELESPGILTPEQDKELRDKTLQIAKRDEKILGPLKEDHFGEEQAADLKKELGTEGDNSNAETSYQSREEVPEQARELWDIMSALKDDPHDDRWED